MGFKEPTEIERLELLCLGSAGIDMQERRAQRDFVASANKSAKLPIKGSDDEEAKASPVKWGKPIDNLFREVELPEGWTIKSEGHAYWTRLLDQKGCCRASMFYKGAFYDREAFIRFDKRYYTTRKYRDNSDEVTFFVYDTGQGEKHAVLHAETPSLPNRQTNPEAYYKALEEAEQRTQAWLVERYPDFKNPNAYWDPPQSP